jgi:phosphoesterase RecJ-like protein
VLALAKRGWIEYNLRMKSKIEELAPEILEQIKKAEHILLSCHRGPDGDSLGSTLALHFYLKSLGKKVTHISGDNPVPKYLSSLPGFDLIEAKNFFEVDLSKIDLYIACDIGGLNQISRIKEVIFPKELKVIVIDHHKSNPGFGSIDLIDETAASACQIVYYLFKQWGVSITPEMAANLFVGMYTDSGGFKYPLTTEDTLLAAAELVKINPDFHKFIFEMENSLEPAFITFQTLALNNLEMAFDGQVAFSIVANHELLDKKILAKEWSPSEVANLFKSVKGWEIGVCLTEKEKGVFGGSFRTRDGVKFDLTKVTTLLGGGGHAAASGAPIKASSANEAKLKLLEALAKSYPDLGQP